MLKNLVIYAFLSAFFTLSGCSLFGPAKTPKMDVYTLSPSIPGKSSKHHDGKGTLLVITPTAGPGLDSPHMVYTKKTYEISQFSENSWVAPPASMISPLLIQSIQNSGCFTAVVSSPFLGTADFNLQTNITTLQQEFTGDASRVRVKMSVSLIDNASEKVTQQQFEAVVSAAANNPYAGVMAANEAVSIILRKVNQFVCK